MRALTPKQEAFCQAFVECGVLTDAYRKAYSPKATKDGVVQKAAKLLAKVPRVAARIIELRDERPEFDALNPRQEAFCQLYIESGDRTGAYMGAYGQPGTRSSVTRKAWRLMQNPLIEARIATLQGELVERNNLTKDMLAAQYMQSFDLAIDERNPSAAVAATTGLANLCGFLTTKVDHNININVEEARKAVATLLAKHGNVIEGNFERSAG